MPVKKRKTNYKYYAFAYRLLLEQGKNTEDLRRFCNASTGAVSTWMRGYSIPPERYRKLIVDYFKHYSLKELLTEDVNGGYLLRNISTYDRRIGIDDIPDVMPDDVNNSIVSDSSLTVSNDYHMEVVKERDFWKNSFHNIVKEFASMQTMFADGCSSWLKKAIELNYMGESLDVSN
jgi:hypothetical protein